MAKKEINKQMLENYPIFIKILFFFFGAFAIVYILVPKIIAVAHDKQLLVKPNKRSSHKIVTPAFGGVAFYISFIIMFSLLRNEFAIVESNFIVPAVTILFVVGLKDDLVSISPRTKLMGQLIALFLVLSSREFDVNSLYGFLGIYDISPWIIRPILIFLLIGLINSYNLIDGVDGLASMIGMVIMTAYAILFYQLNEPVYLLMAVILLGCFTAFLRFNITKNCTIKIFLGDTGSLFIGFVIAVMTLKLMSIPELNFKESLILASNLPILIGSILFIPFFDTTRVMLVRYIAKKPILYPDRNHIHHLLLDRGFTHIETSVIISSIALLIVIIISQLSFILNSFWLLGIVLLFYGLLFTFFHHIKKKNLLEIESAKLATA